MNDSPKIKKVTDFNPKDLDLEFGRLVWIEHTESDLAEGLRGPGKLWFVDKEMTMYLMSIDTETKGE